MKRMFGFAVLVFLLLGCAGKEGPVGPQGPEGTPGTKGDSGVSVGVPCHYLQLEGVLPQPIMWYDSSFSYWKVSIPASANEDSMIVQVWVQMDAFHLWFEPTWYYDSFVGLYGSAVRIINNGTVLPGYLYRVSVIWF